MADIRPGSAGEHVLQEDSGSGERADRFYRSQVTSRLTPRMAEFIGRATMAFIATSDAAGNCDCSPRFGEQGFLRVLNDETIAYPELRGNGVKASLGNILENPHVAVLLVDFEDRIGLHVNGAARVLAPAQMARLDPRLPPPESNGRRPEHWVIVWVEEAYIHCRKHIPHMIPQPRVQQDWGTDDAARKGGDYFGTAASRARADPGAG